MRRKCVVENTSWYSRSIGSEQKIVLITAVYLVAIFYSRGVGSDEYALVVLSVVR